MLKALIAVAHEGHAGDHGWLAGAAEPLLSWDHFAAGLFVALIVAIGVSAVAKPLPDELTNVTGDRDRVGHGDGARSV